MTCRQFLPILSLLTAVCAAQPGYAQQPDQTRRTVSVAGTASTSVMPDFVLWRVDIRETDLNLSNAKRRVDEQVRAVLDLREQLGVERDDLETGPISIRREYEYDERGNQGKFKHFIVSRDIRLRQRNLSRLDEFLSKLLQRAEFNVSFSFQSSKMLDLRMDTWVEASKVAREKARRMVEVQGARLGRVLELKESYLEQDRLQRRLMANSAHFYDGPQHVDATEGTFAPGAISVQVSVLAVFEIADAEDVAVAPITGASRLR